MRVLVTGGRKYQNHAKVYEILDILRNKRGVTVLFAGEASGVDSFALSWAKVRGVPHAMWPACWDRFGKASGNMRNTWMVELAMPEIVIAFPGGTGTADCFNKALQKEGVFCYRVDDKGMCERVGE